jgi:hypothetical protein
MALITPVLPAPDLVTVPLLLSSAGIDRPRTFIPLFAQTLRALVQGTVSESFRKMHPRAYPRKRIPARSPFHSRAPAPTFPCVGDSWRGPKQTPDSGFATVVGRLFFGYLDQSLALLDLFKSGEQRGNKVLNGFAELPVHASEDKLMSWVRPRRASIRVAVDPRHHFCLLGNPRLFPAHLDPANGLPGSILSGL